MQYIIQFLNVLIQFGLLIYITKGSFDGVVSYYSVAYISFIFGSALNYKLYQSEIIKNKIHITTNKYDLIVTIATILYVIYIDKLLISIYYITLLIATYLQSTGYYINIHVDNRIAISRNFYQNSLKALIIVLITFYTNNIIICAITSNIILVLVMLIQKKYENYSIKFLWQSAKVKTIVASYVIPIVGSLVLSIDKIIGGNYISKNNYFELLIYNKIAGGYQIFGDIILKEIKLKMLVIRDVKSIEVGVWGRKFLIQIGMLVLSLPVIILISPYINNILGISYFNYFLYILISTIFIVNSIYGLYFDYLVIKNMVSKLYVISIGQLIVIMASIILTKDMNLWLIVILMCQILGIYVMRKINE